LARIPVSLAEVDDLLDLPPFDFDQRVPDSDQVA